MKKEKNNTENNENLNVPVQTQSVKRKKKKKKTIIIIVIIIILILIWRMVSCTASAVSAASAMVTTTTPIIGDLQESITTSGSVASEETKVYFAPVSGVLGDINVAAGDSVKKGDMLVTYDSGEAEEIYQQAVLQQTISDSTYQGAMSDSSKSQAKLNEANTNLAVLKQQISDHEAYLEQLQEKLNKNQRETSNTLAAESLNLAEKSARLQQELENLTPGSEEYMQKAQELQEVGIAQTRNSYLQQVASSSDYAVKMQEEIDKVTKALTEFKEHEAEMESQKASNENAVLDSYQRERYQADSEMAAMTFAQAQEDYDRALQGIAAEFDGVVTECVAVEGAMVAQGTQLLTLENSNQVKVVFSASKYDLEKLELGQKAEVTISGNVYQGTISKINRMAEVNASGTPMVGIEIHLSNPDDKIILGLDAKIVVYTHKTEGALLVPVEAINGDKDGDFLYVVENNIVVRKPIVCGISSDTYTEILEGIGENDQIILTSFSTIEEGMPAVIMPEGAMMGEGVTEEGNAAEGSSDSAAEGDSSASESTDSNTSAAE